MEINLSKEDATVILKCLTVAKSRKKIEANAHMKRQEIEWSNKKFEFVNKIEELRLYFEYLTK